MASSPPRITTVSLPGSVAVWCVRGAPHRGQPWTPALTLPHVRDGLSVLWMAVLCTFRRPSMGRSVHHEFMRTKLLALTTIVPATACHQRNYVEPYSRSILREFQRIHEIHSSSR